MKKAFSPTTQITLSLLILYAPVHAQNSAPIVAKSSPTKLEIIGAGELRIDGKISAITGDGIWQIEAVSWTSPRGMTVDFDDLKTKVVKVGAGALLHGQGQAAKMALTEVKLGSRVAIIGRNGPDGSLSAREVVLLPPVPEAESFYAIRVNSLTGRILKQADVSGRGGQSKRAIDLSQQALSLAQIANDRPGQVASLTALGTFYDQSEQNDKAIAAFKRAVEIARGTSLETFTRICLGASYVKQGNLKAAIGEFETSDRVLGKDDSTRVNLLINMADVYERAKRPDDQLSTLERLFPLQEVLRQHDNATQTLFSTAALQVEKQPDSARNLLQQALIGLPKVQDPEKRARCLWLAALTTWKLKDKNTAITQLTESSRLYEEVGNAQSAQVLRDMLAQWKVAATANPTPSAMPVATP